METPLIIMPKKPTPTTPIEDAFTRLDNAYHFPMGKMPNSFVKQVLLALFESKTEEEYFERIKQTEL